MTPDRKYHPNIIAGPSYPTSSESFLENRIISKTGFVKFKYKAASEYDHFSRS